MPYSLVFASVVVWLTVGKRNWINHLIVPSIWVDAFAWHATRAQNIKNKKESRRGGTDEVTIDRSGKRPCTVCFPPAFRRQTRLLVVLQRPPSQFSLQLRPLLPAPNQWRFLFWSRRSRQSRWLSVTSWGLQVGMESTVERAPCERY